MYAFRVPNVFTLFFAFPYLVNSDAFMSARKWLQHNLSIGISLFWGRGLFLLTPLDVPFEMEVGAPIQMPEKFLNNATGVNATRVLPSDEEVSAYHEAFLRALDKTFEAGKVKHGVPRETRLQIL
jgi:hypothetical protein